MSNHRVSDRLVTKFWELYSSNKSYSVAWRELEEWCLEDARVRGRDPRQSWSTNSGRAFEAIVQRIIRGQIEGSRLSSTVQITPWGSTPERIREGILSELVWPKGQIIRPERAESNVDVVATLYEGDTPIRVISVYSCKTSTAERYQQDLFWAEKLKARGIHFCFVTREDSLVAYATASDTPASPNKTVVMVQALYDRIYLLTERNITQNISVFRGIGGVIGDLDLWIRAY